MIEGEVRAGSVCRPSQGLVLIKLSIPTTKSPLHEWVTPEDLATRFLRFFAAFTVALALSSCAGVQRGQSSDRINGMVTSVVDGAEKPVLLLMWRRGFARSTRPESATRCFF